MEQTTQNQNSNEEDLHDQAIRMIVAGLSKVQIAKDLGIARATLYNWLDNASFRAKLNSALAEENAVNVQRRITEQRHIADRTLALQRAAVIRITEASIDKRGKLVRLPSAQDMSALERLGRIASNIRNEERLNMGLVPGNKTTINIDNSSNSSTTLPISAGSFKDFIGTISKEDMAKTTPGHTLGDLTINRLLTSGVLEEIRDAELVDE